MRTSWKHLLAALLIGLPPAALILANPSLFLALAMGAPLLMLFAASLAIAGKGNRLAWSFLFLVLSAVLMQAVSLVSLTPGANGVLTGLVICAAVPLGPALILWLAYVFGNWRGRPAMPPAACAR